jgi:hypothetical protein
VQGYFGGWSTSCSQRFIEIWSSLPSLYLLIIIASCHAGFFVLLGILLLLFSWVVAGRRGARRIPARPQFRICPRGARAGPVDRASCGAMCCPTRWWRR